MNEIHEAEALERFLDELIADSDTPAPLAGDLDKEMVTWARQVVLAEQSTPPDSAGVAAVQARVWQRLLANTPRASAARRSIFGLSLSVQAWQRIGMVAACLVVAVGISLFAWISQPPSVSAQEIMEKARAAANMPAAGGVQSFVLTETRRITPAGPGMIAYAGLKQGEELESETKQWYQGPNRWRTEYRQTTLAPDGKQTSSYSYLQVSDGTDIWRYEPGSKSVVVNPFDPAMNGKGALSLFGQDISNLADLFQQASTCFNAKVTGSTVIAGRATYVIDLGPNQCPSASVPDMNGQWVVWVDKETFFVLQQELHSAAGDKVIMSSQVTNIQYNLASIDPSLFTFAPPAGAQVTDNRPKPAPSADQFKQQLEQLAKQVEFPVLAPSYVPQGLAPRQPKIDPAMDNLVEISYFPINEPDKDSLASMMKGLTVREQRATNSLVTSWTDGADPFAVAGRQGWLRRGVRNADNTGSDSAVLVLRDGVLVAASSFTITPEELAKVVASLEPVPGSHAPLPNPTPPSLAELRNRFSFPILVPAFVPAGLTPEPPTGGESPEENITIKYHQVNGAVALTLVNGTLNCCPGLDRMKSEPVKLSNGVSGKFADLGANAGGLSLWFSQDNRTVSLQSTVLTRDQMLQVAASMSKTADLGKVEQAPARPTPTPLPAPKYPVLRPTWLPETMTEREQREGDSIILGFDPRTGDVPHDVLTLREMLKSILVPGGSPDPQETRESIDGHQVKIVRRGQDCITLTWEVGDLQLTLTNPYDPPGHPRYSCDQLRQVLESIR